MFIVQKFQQMFLFKLKITSMLLNKHIIKAVILEKD